MSLISSLKRIFYRLFLKSEISTKEQDFIEKVIPNISFGDVIWAERVAVDFEEIEAGHEEGPFIVVGKTADRLICCYCTSVNGKADFIEIGKDLFPKKTYTSAKKIIALDYIAFKRRAGSLNEADKNKIKKLIGLNIHIQYDNFGLKKDLKLQDTPLPQIGDVFRYRGEIVVIVDINNGSYVALPIDNYNILNNSINFSEDINVYNVFEIRVLYYSYINSLSNQQLEIIRKKYEEYLNNKEKASIPLNSLQRGHVVKNKQEEYFYVYNLDKQLAEIYALELIDEANDSSICLGGQNFIPMFQPTFTKKITDTEDLTLVHVANDEEMTTLKNRRRKLIKTQKELVASLMPKKMPKKKDSAFENKKSSLEVGTVITSSQFGVEQFIVLGYVENRIITIKLLPYIENKEREIQLFKQDDDFSIDQETTSSLEQYYFELKSVFNGIANLYRKRIK